MCEAYRPPQPALWVQTSAFLTVPELEQRPQLNFHLMALALPLHPVWLLKMSQVQGWGWSHVWRAP